jgi:chromosome segregation protein
LPVRFARLRIIGFKSFADAASLEILPGLTGVVGPNGCGKSNIADALRWVMGEASARSLRGFEMEDVIFAGTASRASRNSGEVTIMLEQTAGLAPPPFQAEPELEITRRIERGSGSAYRVNGREARARDVQTLFADFASGAHASAMVSQGRVAALVNARADERRHILEEAAGITGLHARRHEAELKLRAAEANLSRAEDLRGQIAQRLTELRKQARQAKRYRDLSAAISKAEIEHLAVEHAIAKERRKTVRLAFAAAEASAASIGAAVAEAAANTQASSNRLPDLRAAEAGCRTAMERARIGAEQAVEAEARSRAARLDAEQRAAALERDHDHAERSRRDAHEAIAALEAERAHLAAEAQARPALIQQAEQEALAMAVALEHAEAAMTRTAETTARAGAETEQGRHQHKDAETRARRGKVRHDEVLAAYRHAKAALIPDTRVDGARAARDAAEAEQKSAKTALDQATEAVLIADAARSEAEQQLAFHRRAAMAAESRAAGLRAEANALASLLAQKFGRDQAPVLDEVTVPAGLEAALGAALRDDLLAGTDQAATRHWRVLEHGMMPHAKPPALPSLEGMVTGPPALVRALGQILLLPDGARGDDLQSHLAAGQCLVSRQGALWRWDGFTRQAGAPDEAAVRLAQRNRLKQLQAELVIATEQLKAAATARAEAELHEKQARAAETGAREARRAAEHRADQFRARAAQCADALTRLEAEAERAAARANTLEGELRRAVAAADEAAAESAAAQAFLSALPDIDALRQILDAARAALAKARHDENAARAHLMQQRMATDAAAKRSDIIHREIADWQMRAADAESRLTDLAARRDAARLALARFREAADSPALKHGAFKARDVAEAAHRDAASILAAALRSHEIAAREMREREAALAAAREALARQEGMIGQADHAWGMVKETILHRLGANPALPEIADADPQIADAARRRFDRLTGEREAMGPVNLRAGAELAETETRIAAIERDRDDIASAIAKLRGSIGHLNREGRQRLTAIFNEVDKHFQALFTRMFGGGHAHLALAGADDPLQAGLEIYAQPPGKKLAALSLLSGGEQALTALSLIFAVFRCNPAPIAVLDEVDAPLDDANVERFCTLLEDIVRDTGTRMLVVTHHHLTMARMDQLYGVTMQERGISRLLSVDLGRAVALTEQNTALAAE